MGIGLFAPVRFPVAARVNKRAFAAKARRTRRRRLGSSRQDCLTSCDESGHLLVIKQCDPMDPSPPLANRLDKDVAMHGYDLACMRHQSVSLRRQLDDV